MSVWFLEQAADGRLGVRGIRRQADDREPRPRDVVLPEPSHLLAESELVVRHRRRVSLIAVGSGIVPARDGEGDEGAESAITIVSARAIGR